MTKEDLINKIREFVSYLDERVNLSRNGETDKNLASFTRREAVYAAYHKSRDRIYEIFPELKPKDYKTLDDVVI